MVLGAEFSEGREWLGLSRDEEGDDTLLECSGTTCVKGQSTIICTTSISSCYSKSTLAGYCSIAI